MKIKRIILLVVMAVLLYGGWYLYGGSTVPQGQPPLMRLNSSNIASLKNAFNDSAGSVRVLIILSPT